MCGPMSEDETEGERHALDSKGDTKEAAPQSLWSVETDSVWGKEFMTSPINSSV